jgi:hypothetical protein
MRLSGDAAQQALMLGFPLSKACREFEYAPRDSLLLWCASLGGMVQCLLGLIHQATLTQRGAQGVAHSRMPNAHQARKRIF